MNCECGTTMNGCQRCGFPFVCISCDKFGGGCLCPRTNLQIFLAGEDVDLDNLADELHLEDEDFDVLWFNLETPANG